MVLGDGIEVIKKVPSEIRPMKRTDAKVPKYDIPQPEDHQGKSSESVLTRREQEVLYLAFLGKSDREIAQALYITKRTASFHLANVYHKLKVNNRIQAFHEATRLGLISVEPFASASEL